MKRVGSMLLTQGGKHRDEERETVRRETEI
jgi:hypothetical protein